MSDTQPQPRKAYHGSCHCGRTRYIAFISLPPAPPTSVPESTNSRVRFGKCNCTACHKTGFFHMHLPDPSNDFYILSPDDVSELGDYTCAQGLLHWYFCKICGVRCFISAREWEVDQVDLEALGVSVNLPVGYAVAVAGDERKMQVLRLGLAGKEQKRSLSVNALSLDQDQACGLGLDLRELVDKWWVSYLDHKEKSREA